MSKINGQDVILSIVVNASPQQVQPIGCSRTCTLTTNAVTAAKSTKGSGKFSEFKALSINWSVSVDGLATIGENISIAQLRNYQFTLKPVTIFFTETQGANVVSYMGSAIITSIAATGAYNNVETYSCQLQGTGQLYSSGTLVITGVVIHALPSHDADITFSYDTISGATSYIIEVKDLTNNTTTTNTGGAAPRVITVDGRYNYSFRIKDNFTNTYSDYIYYP